MFTTTDHMYVLAFYGNQDFFFNATYSHIDSKLFKYDLFYFNNTESLIK